MALSGAHAAGLARCRFAGDDAPGAPRVYALPAAPAAASETPESARALARRQTRQALSALLANELGSPPSAIALSDTRGQPPRMAGHEGIGLSLSHERTFSLLALAPGGAVGVDVVAADAALPPAELRRLAALYLGPKWAPESEGSARPATFSIAFWNAWAAHEARLKCLGQPLTEWTPALARRLAGVPATAVALPPWAGRHHAAAVAWRRL